MKRNIPVLLLLIMPLLTFSQESPIEYFEGQIFYDVEYSEVEEGYSANWLELNLGSRMVLTFKNGNTKKEYFSRDGILLSTRYLNLKELRSYAVYTYDDTVLWFDITENDTKLDFQVIKDTLIGDFSCSRVDTKSETISNGDTSKYFARWYFADSLKLNADWYDNYNEGSYNEIMDSIPLIPVEYFVSGYPWVQRHKFYKVEQRKVKRKEVLFTPRRKTPKKKL